MADCRPPTLSGLPLLGNLLEYRRDHTDIFWRGYETLGPIFAIRLGPQRAVVLIGPEYQRFFFTEVDRTLSMREVYRFVIPMFGPVLNASDNADVRRSQLALLHSAFQGRKMDCHVDAMVKETSAWLDSLGDMGSFDLFESLSTLGMNIAASTFMGPEIRSKMDEFRPLFEDLARGLEFVLPPNLPLPRLRRRDRARRQLIELITPIIAQRRAHPERYDDFLQTIIQGSYLRDGQAREETVVGLALLTVFTAYITTAAQASWSLIQLLMDRSFLALVEEEQQAIVGDGADGITVETLGRLQRLGWALKETQRMHPVMTHYARYNARSYELGGYKVPQGWLTMVCPAVAHRLPDVFAQPNVYDPARFSPERAEDQRKPFSFIGFGAGLYRCPGAGFGTAEMKCIVAMLLQRYTLELTESRSGRDYEMGVVRPAQPSRVAYRRHLRNEQWSFARVGA